MTPEAEKLQLQFSIFSVVNKSVLLRQLAHNATDFLGVTSIEAKNTAIAQATQELLAELRKTVGNQATVALSFHPTQIINPHDFIQLFQGHIASVDFPDIESCSSPIKKIPHNRLSLQRELQAPSLSLLNKIKMKATFLPTVFGLDIVWMLLNKHDAIVQEKSVASAVKEIGGEEPVMVRLSSQYFISTNIYGEQAWNPAEFDRIVAFLKKLHKEKHIKVAVEISPHHTQGTRENLQTHPEAAYDAVKKLAGSLADEKITVGYELDLGHLQNLHGSEKVALEKIKEILFSDNQLPVLNISITPSGEHHTGIEESENYISQAIEIAAQAHQEGRWLNPVLIIETRHAELATTKELLPGWVSRFQRNRLAE